MIDDRYQYFRIEAREILEGLTKGILQLEKGTAAPDEVPRLLRLAHTLKGAARVVQQPRIAELAHTVEGLLAAHREAGGLLASVQGSALLRFFDEMTVLVQLLELPAFPDVNTPARATEEAPRETLRIEIREMDALLRSVDNTAVKLTSVHKGLDELDRVRALMDQLLEALGQRPREETARASPSVVRAKSLAEAARSTLQRSQRLLASDVDRVRVDLAEVRDQAQRLRLTSAHTLFASLDRAARDAADACGKRVRFETCGGEVGLDASVLAAMRGALMHVVRNAVAHGVEAAAQREAMGKPLIAQVRVEVRRHGNRVAFSCRDDGAGVDVAAVRAAAVAGGMLNAAEAQALPPDKVIALLGIAGLSTAGTVTELSGRGIGLDTVRATAALLKGEMRIRSEAGRGTTVEIDVPISIASMRGLLVEAAGTVAAIPLEAVRRTLRFPETDVVRAADHSSIVHEGNVIPFVPLDRALWRGGSRTRARRTWSAVVVEAGGKSIALGVDRLRGTSNIVMRSLPELIAVEPVVAGASLDTEGNPQLVLNPLGLMSAIESHGAQLTDDAVGPSASILVIDDSLTTRMLEKSILESAGYTVDVAVSAEEGLLKAQASRYGLFIVDVEMPGMNGFEFVAATRAAPALRDVPAILVTSRNAAEDVARGQEVGAGAYIVKSEFDQEHLLRSIRSLMG